MSLILFDLETTGLPSRAGLQFGQYHPFSDTSKYNDARIVQISYMVCDNQLNTISMHDSVINSLGLFSIPNSHIHGITDETSMSTGEDFDDVLSRFEVALKGAQMIVAHNADFDMNVLKSELFRRGNIRLLDDLCSKTVICTMKACKAVCNVLNVYNRQKYPTLRELYEFAVDKTMEKAHDSKYDVINMHEAVKALYDRHLFDFPYDVQLAKINV